jgi:hypothetical protein
MSRGTDRLIERGSAWEWLPPILIIPVVILSIAALPLTIFVPLRLLRRWGIYN